MKGSNNQKGTEITYKKVDEHGIPDERYSELDPKLVQIIEADILLSNNKTKWSEIAGLNFAKKTIKEIIIYPIKNPHLFVGLRKPPKGILLFGPPGTGKTMIGKAISSECNSTFFNIPASSLTSKWVGEGEKLVKTLFKLAVIHQPSVIFIDEIDSLLCSRSENENEASRKIKTEFMVHVEGAATNDDDKILIIGATNRPFELDDAVRRRFVKRLYIPLPTYEGRLQFFRNLIPEQTKKGVKMHFSEQDYDEISKICKGYSGADLDSLSQESSMEPIREKMNDDANEIDSDSLRAVNINDFKQSMKFVKPSVDQEDLHKFLKWNEKFGSYQYNENDLNS